MLEIATALALGIVSVVTALGVLQASIWTADAGRFSSDAADARDQSISIGVTSQLKQRADFGATLEARLYALRQDAALAEDDYITALELETQLQGVLGNAYNLPDGSFDEWRAAGFPDDANPAQSGAYLVETRGLGDAAILTSKRLGELAKTLNERAGIFGQASLVHALALFLFGVAGINRLRAARVVTLALGAGVFLFGLFLMASAY